MYQGRYENNAPRVTTDHVLVRGEWMSPKGHYHLVTLMGYTKYDFS